MTDFHPLKVKDVYKDTKDTVVVSFEIDEALQDSFHFSQGQHLTLRKTIEGQDVRRSYSLCSSPLENEWKVST